MFHSLIFSLFLALFFNTLEGAYGRSGYIDTEQSAFLHETKDSIDSLRHQVENQEIELRTFEQKLESFTAILESLKEQLDVSNSLQKEQNRCQVSATEGKFSSFETATKTLKQDLKRLQTHANETSATLELFRQKLSSWEEIIQGQNQNIEHLQTALQTMMEALQVKMEGSFAGKTYKIKNGDSLEKIARAHGTNVKAIMDLNHLSSDKIIVGKTLKIPD